MTANEIVLQVIVQAQRLDYPYIRHWCDLHGTRDLLEELIGKNAPI
jgi:hypothetical protein